MDKTIKILSYGALASCAAILAGCAGLAINEDWQENLKEAGDAMREAYREINWN
ncbi:MAG: hypothetical protein AAB439_03655 [Patescibacteria group bacterium]